MGMFAPPVTDTRFRLTQDQSDRLAAQFGTPLYVVDEAHFRAQLRRYRNAAIQAWGKSEISFATKANSTVALIKIADQEGCFIDVASEGELRAAMAAGVSPSQCHLHGNNKTREEIGFAVSVGIGHIVADHFGELDMLKEIGGNAKVVLRLAPGVDPVTHHKISTGQADTKFGFNITDGSAEKATKRCLELSLNLIGFHCHVGSQLLDPEAQVSGGELIAQFALDMHNRHGFSAHYLNVGGGLGIRYTSKDEPMPVEGYCRMIAESVMKALDGSGLDVVLGQEPGRSLIGESGLTLYRVGVVKTVPAKNIGYRTYVAVDGGLSDNPRPALYSSVYTVERVSPPTRGSLSSFTVSGKHCETDKLFPNVELASDIASGDLIQVLCTGAYNSSMASNYNRYRRPGTVLVRTDGSFSLIQRPETWDELLSRDLLPDNLAGTL